MNKGSSLTFKITALVVGPMLLLSAVLSVMFSATNYIRSRNAVFSQLESACVSAYELMKLEGGELFDAKSAVECFDSIKEKTGVDITLFEGDKRKITTIRNPDGERAVGTRASAAVVRNVLQKGEVYSSDDIVVNGTRYFGYYIPLTDESGSCVGMVFAGKSSAEVSENVNRDTFRGLVVSWIVTILLGFFGVVFARNMSGALSEAVVFLDRVSDGDTRCTADESLVSRSDEIGVMGRAAVKLQRSLRSLIATDPLTELYNRRAFDHILSEMSERSKNGEQMTIVMGDIDFFKRFNDKWGHDCGDAVLRDIAEIIRKNTGVCGEAARWGGEEFLIAFCAESYENVLLRMKNLMETIREYRCHYNGEEIPVAMTFGIEKHESGADPYETIRRADAKLYYGKEHGRNALIESPADENEVCKS